MLQHAQKKHEKQLHVRQCYDRRKNRCKWYPVVMFVIVTIFASPAIRKAKFIPKIGIHNGYNSRGNSGNRDQYRLRNSSSHRDGSRHRHNNNVGERSNTPHRSHSGSRDKRVAFSDTRRAGRCFCCGMSGHFLAQCVASPKVVSQYRRKLDETSERNQRNRF